MLPGGGGGGLEKKKPIEIVAMFFVLHSTSVYRIVKIGFFFFFLLLLSLMQLNLIVLQIICIDFDTKEESRNAITDLFFFRATHIPPKAALNV